MHDWYENCFSVRAHVCLRFLRKLFQKGRILLQILLKLYSEDPDKIILFKITKIHHLISLEFAFKKCNLNTNKTNSDSPIKPDSVLKNSLDYLLKYDL